MKPQFSLRKPSPVDPAAAEAFIQGGEAPTAQPLSLVPPAPPQPVVAALAAPPATVPFELPPIATAPVGGSLAESEPGPKPEAGAPSPRRSSRPAVAAPRKAVRAIRQLASGEERRRIWAYVDPELAKKLKIYCVTHDYEMTDVVETALTRYLNRE